MPARSKKSKAVPLNIGGVAAVAKAKPYVQRLIQDEELRANVRTAFDSGRSAYGRLSNGKAARKTLLEDKKLHGDLREAAEALREASVALNQGPQKAKKKRGLGRKLLVLLLAAALALALSEKLRSKVLDALFGAEEEFEYTPPPPPASSQPAAPVSAA
jgi:hypothetical protein